MPGSLLSISSCQFQMESPEKGLGEEAGKLRMKTHHYHGVWNKLPILVNEPLRSESFRVTKVILVLQGRTDEGDDLSALWNFVLLSSLRARNIEVSCCFMSQRHGNNVTFPLEFMDECFSVWAFDSFLICCKNLRLHHYKYFYFSPDHHLTWC